MAVVAVTALVPILGFASWFIAGPMLLISFIMIILVFINGGVGHGLALLGCQIFIMPLIVVFGPLISSALGLAGAAVAIESASTPGDFLPADDNDMLPDNAGSGEDNATSSASQPLRLPADLESLKARILEQQPSISTWVRTGLAVETPSGFLKSGDSADLPTRRSLQQQNLWRGQVFDSIAVLTGTSREEVAKVYVRLASGQ